MSKFLSFPPVHSKINKTLKEGNSYGVEQLLRWVAVPDEHFSKLPSQLERECEMSIKSGRLYSHGQRLEKGSQQLRRPLEVHQRPDCPQEVAARTGTYCVPQQQQSVVSEMQQRSRPEQTRRQLNWASELANEQGLAIACVSLASSQLGIYPF